MKNIFLALIIVTLVLSVFPLAIHAEELPETTLEEVTTVTEPVETPNEETPTETPTEAPTSHEEDTAASFLARIQEAWEKGEITDIINIAIKIAILIVLGILDKKIKKANLKTIGELASGNKTTVGALNTVADAANDVTKLLGGFGKEFENFKTEMAEQVENIANLDKEKLENYGKQLANCMAIQKLVAEMLQQVYANSTTIPMSTKNIIGQKYVEICDLMKKETTNEQ